MDARLPVLRDAEGHLFDDLPFGPDAAPGPDAAAGTPPELARRGDTPSGSPAAAAQPVTPSGGNTVRSPAIRSDALGPVLPPEPAPDDLIPLETYEIEDEELGPPDFLEPEPVTTAVSGAAAPAEAVPPDAVGDFIARAASVYASGAAGAFMARRMELQSKHGPKAATDLSRPVCLTASELHQRVIAMLDHLRAREPRPADAISDALRCLEGAGALALALHDRLSADLAEAKTREALR